MCVDDLPGTLDHSVGKENATRNSMREVAIQSIDLIHTCIDMQLQLGRFGAALGNMNSARPWIRFYELSRYSS